MAQFQPRGCTQVSWFLQSSSLPAPAQGVPMGEGGRPSSPQSCLGLQHKKQSLLLFWREQGRPQPWLHLGWRHVGWRPVGPDKWEAGQWAGAGSCGLCWLLAWRAPLLPASAANECCSLAAPTVIRNMVL